MTREPKNPRVILLEDHHHIETLLERLIATIRSSDREAGERAWRKIEDVLLRHLDVEEMFVFPPLHEGHAAEVDRLRREHDAIRKAIGEIGLALELHTLRCETLESFCTMLREHAQREDSLAYVLAGRTLSIGIMRAIGSRLKAAVTNLQAPRKRASRRASGVPS
ncbi:MAG TPA: hemerythrin domain-containing protein [Polyangiaceae bacterium]|jgi:hemerythrin-like domain-containing protein